MSQNNERQAEARRLLILALEYPDESKLSNVLYDAAFDGIEQPDGDGGWEENNYGYDCDDLAHVLWSILQADK